MSDTSDDAEQHEGSSDALEVEDLDVPSTDADALSGGQKLTELDEEKGHS